MLKRIVSGSQTGADIAGLKAAKKAGIETGGYAPKGWWTLKGSRPEYAEMYGMVECQTSGYPARTEQNVINSDATLRFASDFFSPGERCTLKFLEKHKKPYLDIDIDNPAPISAVKNWILDNKIEILNIAGNSEQTSKGIDRYVMEYMVKVFALLNSEDDEVPF